MVAIIGSVAAGRAVMRAAAAFELQGRSLALFRLRGSNAAQSENHAAAPSVRLKKQRQE